MSWYRLGLTSLLLLFCMQFTSHAQSSTTLNKQRELFQSANQALEKGHTRTFQRLMSDKRLQTYPLYVYLQYQAFIKDLNQGRLPNTKIKQFLAQQKNTPFHDRLERQWLTALYNKKWWRTLTKYYEQNLSAQSVSASMQCRYLWARYELNFKTQSINRFKTLWAQSASSLPKTCNQLIYVMKKRKALTSSLAWQRISASMQKRNYQLADYLSRYLSSRDKTAYRAWRNLRRNPERIAWRSLQKAITSHKNQIAYDTLQRLAKSKPDKAASVWPKVANQFNLTQNQKLKIIESIALYLSLNKSSKAQAWIDKIPVQKLSTTLISWQIRNALYHKQWPKVLSAIQKLPKTVQQENTWQYWKARALEQTGQKTTARALFQAVAKQRSYYGFLASIRLKQPFSLNRQSVVVSEATSKQVAANPRFQQVYEFNKLGYDSFARSSWFYLLQTLSNPQRLAAAKIAHDYGWYNLSVLAVARTPHRDDLKLRFPMAHYSTILRYAKRYDISAAWIFSIARQESIFHEHAHSPVGAKGVMQLLPSTARFVARKIGVRHYNSKLLDARYNIALGTAYLKRLLNRYNNRLILALAAYNAGIGRVNQWIPKNRALDADIWTETIPYKETRHYIKNILAYTVVYNSRLGRHSKLSAQLYRIPRLRDFS